MCTLAKRSMFFLIFLLAAAVLVGVSPGQVSAQKNATAAPLPISIAEKSIFGTYKGVTIGMPAAGVREKLGKPADQSDVEDNFTFSDSESARVFYDTDKTVRVISVMYTGNLKSAPVPKAIIGTDVTAKPDGALHKTVNYPRDGFWISYARTGGDDAIVIVTIQKMAKQN